MAVFFIFSCFLLQGVSGLWQVCLADTFSIALRNLSFRSNHQSAQTSVTHKCSSFIPLRSPFTYPLRPKSLAFIPQPFTQAKILGLHSTLRRSLHSILSLPLLFLPIPAVCPASYSPHKKGEHTCQYTSNGYFFNLIFRPKSLTYFETNILIVIAIEILVIM